MMLIDAVFYGDQLSLYLIKSKLTQHRLITVQDCFSLTIGIEDAKRFFTIFKIIIFIKIVKK